MPIQRTVAAKSQTGPSFEQQMEKKYLLTWGQLTEKHLRGHHTKYDSLEVLKKLKWHDKSPLDVLLTIPTFVEFVTNMPSCKSIHPDLRKLFDHSPTSFEAGELLITLSGMSPARARSFKQNRSINKLLTSWSKFEAVLTRAVMLHGKDAAVFFDGLSEPSKLFKPKYFEYNWYTGTSPFDEWASAKKVWHTSLIINQVELDYLITELKLPSELLSAPFNLKELIVTRLLNLVKQVVLGKTQSPTALLGRLIAYQYALRSPDQPQVTLSTAPAKRASRKKATPVIVAKDPVVTVPSHSREYEQDVKMRTGTVTIVADLNIVSGLVSVRDLTISDIDLSDPLYDHKSLTVKVPAEQQKVLAQRLSESLSPIVSDFYQSEWKAQLAYREAKLTEKRNALIKNALSKLTPEEIELLGIAVKK